MKLYYFDERNLAEPIRMALHYGNEKFDDIRIAETDWDSWKDKMPYGKVPVLDVDGKQLGESAAISRYIARKVGLIADTEWEQAKADELISIQKDFYKEISPFLYSAVGFRDPEKKDEYYESVAKPVSAKYLKLYSELLEKSPSGFFIGTHETHADFWIAEFIFTLNGMIPEIVSNYPILLAHLNRIHELPQLKEYIATRKPTAL